MKRQLIVAAAALGLAATAVAQTKEVTPLRSLVEAERAFARMSLETGTKEAFLANFAPDSVLFRPLPVEAPAFLAASPASPGLLTWEPVVAGISAAGDLGYTTGPWEWRPKRSLDEKAAAHGYFVSVWRRQADGSWKVLFDHGASNPEPPSRPVAPGFDAGGPKAPPLGAAEVEASRGALERAEAALERAIAEQGSAAAYAAHAADDFRLHREGRLPVEGKGAAVAALDARLGAVEWAEARAGVAASGDLGYTYGSMTAKGAGAKPEQSVFLRIWRREAGAPWRLVLDITTPVPPAK